MSNETIKLIFILDALLYKVVFYKCTPVSILGDVSANNLSAKLDSDHRVNFSTPTSCQSATFVGPLFAFVLCFFYDKKS